MPPPFALGERQRFWPQALARGVYVRESLYHGQWRTDQEIADIEQISVRTVQRRFSRGTIEAAPHPGKRSRMQKLAERMKREKRMDALAFEDQQPEDNYRCELLRAWR